MTNDTSHHSKLNRLIANTVLLFFLFTTFFSGIPGVSISPPKAEAAGDITYTTNYSYDNNGNVISRTTPNNHTIQYTYNGLNRLTKITYPDLSEANYVYDVNGNKIEMTDAHGTTYYSYDQFNRLRSVQYPGIVPIMTMTRQVTL